MKNNGMITRIYVSPAFYWSTTDNKVQILNSGVFWRTGNRHVPLIDINAS